MKHVKNYWRKAKCGSQWLEGVKNLIEDCPVRSVRIGKDVKQTPSFRFVNSLAECARGRALKAIDDLLRDDVIPIFDGLDFVRYHGKFRSARSENFSVTFDISKLLRRVRSEDETETYENQRQFEDTSWREGLVKRLGQLLHTHVIKLNPERLGTALSRIGNHDDDISSSLEQPMVVEARGRRRKKKQQMQLMPLIMMGVLLMSTVLIPMGFQFLAVLGGKALILAKMALMLSSIQGLKKIATSGVNYGLYHSPVPEWHERSDVPPSHNAPVYQPTSYLDGFVG
ncbi:hypothetical protein QAD02_011248 [Eretmocerus hayati]|uniref:Uncharacterized protein n=1 Tax=Eretmocerus hayati TaxID=131215 RepID=A0ACC2NYZ1_9HYME|nr:hypothetical protein QAD02_011248 [Eretmocerus hayati]